MHPIQILYTKIIERRDAVRERYSKGTYTSVSQVAHFDAALARLDGAQRKVERKLDELGLKRPQRNRVTRMYAFGASVGTTYERIPWFV